MSAKVSSMEQAIEAAAEWFLIPNVNYVEIEQA